jgi:RNA polymerase sigma factor (TIGR02999 family)
MGAQAMRRLLVDHGRGHRRVKRGGGERPTTLHEWLDAAEAAPLDVEDALTLDAALARLAAADERQATIVELRYFGGLTLEETAVVTGISLASVKREWAMARAWLRRELATPGQV